MTIITVKDPKLNNIINKNYSARVENEKILAHNIKDFITGNLVMNFKSLQKFVQSHIFINNHPMPNVDATHLALFAAEYGILEVIDCLLKEKLIGLDDIYNSVYPINCTLLTKAAHEGQLNIVKLLVEKGADLKKEMEHPLKVAIREGHTEVVDFLIKFSDIKAIEQGNSFKLLELASWYGHFEIFKILINYPQVEKDFTQSLKYALDPFVPINPGVFEIIKFLNNNFKDQIDFSKFSPSQYDLDKLLYKAVETHAYEAAKILSNYGAKKDYKPASNKISTAKLLIQQAEKIHILNAKDYHFNSLLNWVNEINIRDAKVKVSNEAIKDHSSNIDLFIHEPEQVDVAEKTASNISSDLGWGATLCSWLKF